MHTIAEKKLLMLKPDDILASSHQPRNTFDDYDLRSLADSISSSGIIQPLTVRKSEGGKYVLIAGERRLRAARLAGLRRVPCILHRTDELTAALYTITENLQRTDLNFFEEAAAIKRLTDDFGLSQSEVAIRLGMANSTVSNKIRLLRISPEIRERIISARLTERHARSLLRLPDELRASALDKIIADELNLTQAEEFIENLLNPPCNEKPSESEQQKPIRKAAIGDIKLFANSLSKLLTTMQNAGIEAHSRKYETEKYIEYKVRIEKKEGIPKYSQLRIMDVSEKAAQA